MTRSASDGSDDAPGKSDRPRAPWYAAGLRFDCGRCGNCCSGPTGVVRFTPDELKAMATHLGLLPFEFLERYARKDADGRWTLDERPRGDGDYDCVFVARDDAGRASCTIHPVRPTQCRTWPFWPENLTDRERWLEEAPGCKGIAEGEVGKGTLHAADEIERRRDATPPA